MSHTENETNNAFNVLSEMALLMSDTQQLADVSEQKDDLETLTRAFLVGDFADQQKLRNSVLVITDQFKALYTLLERYTRQDVENALRLILKIKSGVQK